MTIGYSMQNVPYSLLLSIGLLILSAFGQGGPDKSPGTVRTVPTFAGSFVTAGKQYSYQFAGGKPEAGGTTTIPTVVVPLSLSFEASGGFSKQAVVMSAADEVRRVVQSPIFQPAAFATGSVQYGDAVQRAQFPKAAEAGWHTVLGKPQVAPVVSVQIPAANGYLLHSRRTGKSLGVVDLDYVQKKLFEQLGKIGAGPDKLVIAVGRNAAFYVLGDATVCCSVGTHGAQLDASKTAAQAFVIGSYMDDGVMPGYRDVQGISQQVAEWMNDPLHGFQTNSFPAWRNPVAEAGCGGRGESSSYLLEQPTDYLGSGATELSAHGGSYHLENMALLPWFAESAAADTFHGAYSFPDMKALSGPAQGCVGRRDRNRNPTVAPLPRIYKPNGHELIGYWEGYASANTKTRLRDVSPQWDVVIATFASPVKGSTSLLHFEPPAALGEDAFQSDVKYLQSQGKKVLISLGGGGQVVTLNTAQDVRNFVSSVTAIVAKYGFDGVDLDIETPSLLIDPDDKDFRHPTTPSIVNLIAAVHQLRDHFGSKFMLTEVPEAAQAQAGMEAYEGQFGSFLAVMYGTRDILSFVDAQDYNTPPLEGLDGNYYFPGHADYHVALGEMLVHGFPVGGNAKEWFPALPPEKVAIGFISTRSSARGYTDVADIENALRYLIAGKPYAGGEYQLRRAAGYPTFLGAMYWAINQDRANDYRMSNAIGRLLHGMGRR